MKYMISIVFMCFFLEEHIISRDFRDVVCVLCMLFVYMEARFIKHINPLLLISE